jgi:limonene-1,2-epoxide hydrolase
VHQENKQIVLNLWDCLYAKKWEDLEALLSENCWHEDVPAPDLGARGAKNIVERVRIGFDLIERFEHDVHRVAGEKNTVFIEHTERWYFKEGEIVQNNLVSVHEVFDGKVGLWRDYWDINTMMTQAPQWWIEAVANESPRNFT